MGSLKKKRACQGGGIHKFASVNLELSIFLKTDYEFIKLNIKHF